MKQMIKPLIVALSLTMATAASAKGMLPLSEAKQHFDKPFMDFVKVWMPRDVLGQTLSVLDGFIASSENKVRDFYTGDNGNPVVSQPFINNALETFSAYCQAKNGRYEKYRSEAFCLDLDKRGDSIASISWKLRKDFIDFDLNTRSYALRSYQRLTRIAVGENVKTKFGPGIVIETKDGGLIYFQPNQGNPRWITSDDLLAY
jgi:hypothetical protein